MISILKRSEKMPLADKIRPKTMNDVIGQSHIIGNG